MHCVQLLHVKIQTCMVPLIINATSKLEEMMRLKKKTKAYCAKMLFQVIKLQRFDEPDGKKVAYLLNN